MRTTARSAVGAVTARRQLIVLAGPSACARLVTAIRVSTKATVQVLEGSATPNTIRAR